MAVSATEFEKALSALKQALSFAANEVDVDRFALARDASIQRFEFCVELAWKTSAKFLGSSSSSAKPVIREMADHGLIDSTDRWFEFVEARNKSSHTYKEEVAVEVFNVAKRFISDGESLLAKLIAS
jgi:nucleotidyltransferase substrate binding protein (TIGR01987 family)